MTKINLSKLLQKYKSGWVAVSGDYTRVVATAKVTFERYDNSFSIDWIHKRTDVN